MRLPQCLYFKHCWRYHISCDYQSEMSMTWKFQVKLSFLWRRLHSYQPWGFPPLLTILAHY